ncbi:MAG: type II secretion system F family protein [Candidatus Omnitrophica bacterium]|nr:type II secretion system F family protein [Candidatus Omnitrophota bacterium]
MPFYNYKARDKFGKLISASTGAPSEAAAVAQLKQSGYIVVSLEEAKEKKGPAKFYFFKKVKTAELNMLTRLFYTLQKAGLPIIEALAGIAEQLPSKILKGAVVNIVKDVESGASLSVAFGKYPRIFNELYINMLKAGEVAGTLDDNLERLAILGENEEKTNMRIKSATRYPIIVVATMSLAFIFLTNFIMPRFAALYAQFNVALPLPTRMLLALNVITTKYWWVALVIVMLLLLVFKKFVSTKIGRFWWDGLKLKVPIFGPLVLKLSMARFARVTGVLMKSGIPILSILDLSRDSAGNAVIARTIMDIRKSVNEGKGMTEPMKQSGMFPPVVIQMVAAGEEVGKIDELLLHVADYYDQQVDFIINNLVTLIEPILIFALGCAVLLLALAIFLPIWNMASLFRR